jgi:putative phage-type endonuclease
MPELVCAATDPNWHEHRRAGVTATDIVAILGLSADRSAWSLYQQKTGTLPEPADNDRWRLGRELESYIVSRWGEERDWEWIDHGGLFRSSTRPWQMATPDRTIFSYEIELENNGTIQGDLIAVLEVKSWADADRHRWDDAPPPAVRAQVLWQMDVMDVSTGYVGVLFLPSGEFRSYTVEHRGTYSPGDGCADWPAPQHCDACDDQAMMRGLARDFLDRIDLQDPPSVDGSAATLAALKAVYAPAPDVTREIDPGLITALAAFRALARQADAVAKSAEAKIREQAKDATVLTDAVGTKLATRTLSTSVVKEHKRTVDSWHITKTREEDTDDNA